ncbi:DUF1540 domain-containing protein [Fuchsiella alkaliacetigena]|uniref:DUF1540 domain-containing protein n=1 Tax=Fuchsiella alkaliacetigena TaxID=957042 RepID=UPI00200B2DEB|nr:DUF1540 domain-containing protein [Fuchsiella alkaliacetigena]MCK8823651.1 DUF1540 domain-containing protein [Fuchsiella alkaliacetigena]
MSCNDIKCAVSNCKHWEQQHCTASGIEVNVDGGGQSAQNQEKTNCSTFETE